MSDFIYFIILFIIPLSAGVILLFKWWKDYKRTKKILVLYDKKTKYWFPVFLVLLIILIAAIFTDYSEPIEIGPIKIKIEEWNPWGWYG